MRRKPRLSMAGGKPIGLLLSAGMVGLLLTGCGSSPSHTSAAGNTSHSTSSSSAATSNPTGSTWVLGNITTASGPASSTNGKAQGVMKAWEQWTNTHGGINGHPVKVIYEDDQQTPSVGLAAAQTLIHDNVLAIVGESSTTTKIWGSAISQAGIPVVGGNPTSPPFAVDPDFYSQAATFSSGAYLLVKAAQVTGVKKLAVLYCAENPACAEFNPLLQKAASQIGGISIAYTGAVSATAPSYTAPCLAAKASGADGLIMTLANSTLTSVATQCNQQGYKPSVVGAVGSISLPTWTSNPAFNNASVQIDTFPWWDTSNPAAADFNKAMQEFDPTALQDPSIAAETWAAAMLFEAAAKNANLGDNPTSSEIKTGLDSMSNDTLGGLTPPLTYTNGNRIIKCGRFATVSNGAFQLLQNGQYFCSP
jgi:branched-chain amino acid transport system substrate-binding protein